MPIHKYSLAALRVAAVFLVSFVIVSCGTTPESPVLPPAPPPPPPVVKPQPPQPVVEEVPSTTTVGFVAPLSGPHAELGKALQQSAQVAVFDMKNDSIELVFADSKGTAEGAHKAVQDVIAQGAQIVIGPVFAEEVQAVKALATSRKIPLLAFTTDKSMADDYVFVVGFSPQEQIQRILKYAASRGLTRIALLTPSNAYGKLVESAARELAQQNLITIVGRESYALQDMGTPAFATKIETLRASAPQALLIPEGGKILATAIPYWDSYAATDEAVQLLGSGQWDTPELWALPGLEGAWFAAPSPHLRQDFEKSYNSSFGSKPLRIAPLAYDAVSLAAILSARGALSPQALEVSQGFSGIDGIFRFQDHVAQRGLSVLEIKSGNVTIADPAPHRF